MTTAAKKEKNRAYYLKNRDRILDKARARNGSRGKPRLSVVTDGVGQQIGDALQHLASGESAENLRAEDSVSGVQIQSRDLLKEFQSGEADNTKPAPDENFQLAPSEIIGSANRAEYSSTPSDSTPSCLLSGIGTSCSTQFQRGEFQMDSHVNVVWLLPRNAGTSESEWGQLESQLKDQTEVQIDRLTGNHQIPKPNVASPDISRSPMFWLPFSLRLVLVIGLNILMIAMQAAFYKKHDILPHFALPMAIAGELAFISLVSMKFSKHMEWIRVIIFLLFYGYFVSALSFHVFSDTRFSLQSSSSQGISSDRTELTRQLDEARNSLKIAQKGRSWKNMELFGTQVSKLEETIRVLPQSKVLGTSLDQVLAAQVVLLVLLRALLMAAQALNALRLREQIEELWYSCNMASDARGSSNKE